MSNKFETKKLFWKIVNTITENKDLWLKNKNGEITEEGMVLPSGASVTYESKEGVLWLYDKNMDPICRITENNPIVVILKELLEEVEEV